MMTSERQAHSAIVTMRLHLVVGDGAANPVLEIAAMGPDYVLLDAPIDWPPGHALVEMSVDDHTQVWSVYMPTGIAAGVRRVQLTRGPDERYIDSELERLSAEEDSDE